MADKVIKAGYMITVDSWENDGDNGRELSVDGLTRTQVEYYKDLLYLVSNSYHDTSTLGITFYGNMTDDGYDEIELGENDPEPTGHNDIVEGTHRGFRRAVRRINNKYRNLIKDIPEEDLRSFEYGFDIIQNFTGYGSDWYYTRVIESIKVHYNPEEIILVDVTRDF